MRAVVPLCSLEFRVIESSSLAALEYNARFKTQALCAFKQVPSLCAAGEGLLKDFPRTMAAKTKTKIANLKSWQGKHSHESQFGVTVRVLD